jgi:small ligand-binding sensory domain FIST
MSTRAGVGLSQTGDAVEAAREAARAALDGIGEPRADWGLVFATAPHRPHFAPMLAAVQATLGTGSLSGCSGYGVVGAGCEVEADKAIAVLAVRSDRIHAEPHLMAAAEDHGLGATRAIGHRVAAEGGVLVALPDPFAIPPQHMLRELQAAAPGLPAIGGAASSGPRAGATFQFHGRNVATRALAALHLTGALRFCVGITQGCQPLGLECRVTRCHENAVFELDNSPALEVLRARLPAGLGESIELLGGHLFVGLPPDPAATRILPGEYLVRPLVAVDPERQALILGEGVREGQLIIFVVREGQAARDDLKEMLARLASDPGHHAFGLYFNCAGRGSSLYGLPGIDSAFMGRQFGQLPIAGFFGNAEIAPLHGVNQLFTYTGVLALFGEEPPTTR